MKKELELSIVVPCFNEEGNILLFYKKLTSIFGELMNKTEIIFVNDGSKDKTTQELKYIYAQSEYIIKVINFSRNFGKEAAMLAGLKDATGKYTAIIDADLQQNPKYILKMKEILDFNDNYDAVVAYQKKRKENKLVECLKKSFYKIINRISEVELPEAASDFRLLRKNVVKAIVELPEKGRFSKGIFAWVGFNTYTMPYDVEERANGISKWSIKQLFAYAIDGITDFSTKPLTISFSFGILLTITSAIILIILSILKITSYINISGFVFLSMLMVFILGIQLINNAIIGKYISKSYIEIKNRPVYIIKEKLNNQEERKGED